MIKSIFVKLLAVASLAVAAPSIAQIRQIDPNDAGRYEPVTSGNMAAPAASDTEYQPVDPGPQGNVMASPAPAAPAATGGLATGQTVPREDIFTAAEGVFGKGAEGLGGIIEKILKDQGEPSAYIKGHEAGGAFVVGVRYGSGTLHHQIEGDRDVYWTGPSVGFDFGADANKVFVLVYNLYDSQELFRRFPGAEGNAYVVGGFTASYLRRGDIVLVPVRLGVGLRLGVNAGYMNFTEKNRWLPF